MTPTSVRPAAARRLFRPQGLAALALVAAAGACGLVSADIATVTYDMPAKTYTFDTGSPSWKAPPGTYPSVSCGSGGLVADCCQGLPGGPAVDCATTPLVCEQGVCTLEFTVAVVQEVDLRKEVPALMSLSSQSLANIYISQLHYVVKSSLTIAMPPVELFIAPRGATGWCRTSRPRDRPRWSRPAAR